MYKDILLIFLVVVALAAVFSNRLIKSIIYLEVFSLICAVIFIFEGAPDVAIAEAVIASTLVAITTVVTIQQYEKIKIFYINMEYDSRKTRIHKFIEKSCKDTSIMPLFVNLHKLNMKRHVKKTRNNCDVIVTHNGGDITFFFYEDNKYVRHFKDEVIKNIPNLKPVYNVKLVSNDEKTDEV